MVKPTTAMAPPGMIMKIPKAIRQILQQALQLWCAARAGLPCPADLTAILDTAAPLYGLSLNYNYCIWDL